MALEAQTFESVRKHVQEHGAITLEFPLSNAIVQRLHSLVACEQLPDVGRLLDVVRADPCGRLSRVLIELCCATETSFFRDPSSFELLRRFVIPQLIAIRSPARTLRILSCACSSGQEPYSLAMLLVEGFPELATWRVEILGIDLSTGMLERARNGMFTQFEVSHGLPVISLVKHFEQGDSGWRIREHLRRMVQFRELDLARPLDLEPGYDLVLLRNLPPTLAIEARTIVLERVHDLLQPWGIMLLGAAENGLAPSVDMDRVDLKHGTWYRRRVKPAA